MDRLSITDLTNFEDNKGKLLCHIIFISTIKRSTE